MPTSPPPLSHTHELATLVLPVLACPAIFHYLDPWNATSNLNATEHMLALWSPGDKHKSIAREKTSISIEILSHLHIHHRRLVGLTVYVR